MTVKINAVHTSANAFQTFRMEIYPIRKPKVKKRNFVLYIISKKNVKIILDDRRLIQIVFFL